MMERGRSYLIWAFILSLVFGVLLLAPSPANAAASPWWEDTPPGGDRESSQTPGVGAGTSRWLQNTWVSPGNKVQPGAPSNVGHYFGQGFPTVTVGEPFKAADGSLRVDGLFIQPWKFHYMTSNRNPWQLDVRNADWRLTSEAWCTTSTGVQTLIPMFGTIGGTPYNNSNVSGGVLFTAFYRAASAFQSCADGIDSVTYIQITAELRQSFAAEDGTKGPTETVASFTFKWSPTYPWKAHLPVTNPSQCIAWFGLGNDWKPWSTVDIGGTLYTAEELGCNPTIDPGLFDSFEYLCREAPELVWNDWSRLGDWVGHYANCLFVPYRTDADPLVLALEESPIGQAMNVSQLVEDFPSGESCGSVGDLPLVGDFNTCSIEKASQFNTVIRWTVVIGAAVFLIQFLGKYLIGVRFGREEGGE